MPTSQRGPLAPYRVLDLTGSEAAFCTKILADLGADVVKVEPLGGHPDRVRELDWLGYGANSRSVELDLVGERARFLELVRAADFVVESLPPGRLDSLDLGWPVLSRENSRIVMTSVTPFGSEGPYRDFKGPDLVVQALGAVARHMGDADRAPVRIAGQQGWRQGAASAAVGTLIGHFARERTGQAQRVDVSAQVAAFWLLMSESGMPVLQGFEPTRDGVGTRSGGLRRRTIFRCKDGHLAAVLGGGLIGGAMLKELTRWMAEEGAAPEFMIERDWIKWDSAYLLSDPVRGQKEIDATMEAAGSFFLTKTKEELYDMAVKRGLLLAPVYEIRDLLDDAQLRARCFWTELHGVLHPGPFAQMSGTPIAVRRPTPKPGEHTPEVLREWGSPRAELHGVAASEDLDQPKADGVGSDANPNQLHQPFAGLRVLDFTWVVTGPVTGRMLAEFGADVIKVESAKRLDPARTLPPFAEAKPGPNRGQFFANYNAGKRSIALDVSKPEAQEIVRRLVAHTDVLIESFTPGTLDRLGLGYDELRKIRPDLIFVSTCQQGQTGPRASYRGYGSLAAGLAGFYALTGWPDREPAMIYGAYTDFTAHHMTSAALLAALDHRRRTGEGQRIDVAQAEASIHFLAAEVMAQTAQGRSLSRQGNADDHAAPHGVYPCQGHDQWCAIACTTDAEWKALAQMVDAAWTTDPQWRTLAGRKMREAELDALLGRWTQSFDAVALMKRLQHAGVPAGALSSCRELHRDPQLQAREAFVERAHPEMGQTLNEALPFQIPTSPGQLRRAPLLGEHTDDVLIGLLGMTGEEIAGLRSSGVVG